MKLFYSLVLALFVIDAHALKIAVISDLNGSYGQLTYNQAVKNTATHLLENRPDLIIATGDMIAGQKQGLNYLGMWNSFHNIMTIPFKKYGIPFAVTPGNHDGSAAFKFKLERDIFRSQWKTHRPNLNFIHANNYPDYYAFTMDNVLFVSIDATLTGKLSNKQMNWLTDVLQSPVSYRHKIVFGHLPLFATVAKKAKEKLDSRSLEKLFKQTKVTAYLSGHHHAFYPGLKEGIHHVSQGCLGSAPRKLIGTSMRSSRSYSIINLDDDFTVNAVNVEDNFSLINKKSLPKSIQSDNSTIYRDDL